ncbi:DUF1768-domain-containing protein [Cryphonectria parasitica EP155]|uniref:DUF1768-domain-containing protein n=1 Tax=Cryphonectria parasitica (strain ATCC 38755 / EP155) TaxID=660469 RepID=A0A9P5CKA3_CRYP1|nr:DUF1768-domain-containing protein [Cryphonectria parasitica EP155]KAF3760982.1 DUF1768-domain-containing protein [Cryphonectria parasitica EP155]
MMSSSNSDPSRPTGVSKRAHRNNKGKGKAVISEQLANTTLACPEPSSADADPEDRGPIFFWRETEPPHGYMSQWYKYPFYSPSDPSKIFVTAEHWMMYQKAVLFGDNDIAARILAGQKLHPRIIRNMGRKIRGFDDEVWKRERMRIVEEGNWLKFTSPANDDTLKLKAQLLYTWGRELVEASPFDRIWGIGFKAKDAEVARESWGSNLLGIALMHTRERLKKEAEGGNANLVAGAGETHSENSCDDD